MATKKPTITVDAVAVEAVQEGDVDEEEVAAVEDVKTPMTELCRPQQRHMLRQRHHTLQVTK